MPIWFKHLGLTLVSRFIQKGKVYPTRRQIEFYLLREHHCSWVAFEKDYEPAYSNLIEKFIEKGDTAIDVGSNFGWYSILLAKCGCKRVLAFEPNLSAYDVLESNIRLNGFSDVIQTFPRAVGSKEGTGFLELPSDGNSSLGEVRDTNSKSEALQEVKIEPLDSHTSDLLGEISFLKIDAEGSEYDVLSGARNILSHQSAPVIQFEVNDKALRRSGVTSQVVADFLESMEFEIFRPDIDRSDKLKDGIWYALPKGKFGDRFRALFPGFG